MKEIEALRIAARLCPELELPLLSKVEQLFEEELGTRRAALSFAVDVAGRAGLEAHKNRLQEMLDALD